jgi:hypothetical protein
MNSSTRYEIELRAELLRKKYTERELRTMFADRTHDAEFASVGRPVFAGRIAIAEHIVVWTGFEAAVQSLMMSEDLVPCVGESLRNKPNGEPQDVLDAERAMQ